MTGAYLGSFGKGLMNDGAAGIALDTASNRAYIAQFGSSTVQVWDYNTGVLLNEWVCNSNPFQIARLASGNLLIGGGSSASIYTATGSFVSNLEVSGGVYGVATDGSNMLVTNGIAIRSYNSAGVLQASVSESTNYTLTIRGGRVYWGTASGGVSMRSRSATTLGGFTSQSVGALSSGVYLPTAFGHASTLYTSGTLTGGTSAGIARFNVLTGASSSFGAGIVHDARGMAIVLAPEPGSWVALGLGAIALMRRRRK